jgi:hypothetical protein
VLEVKMTEPPVQNDIAGAVILAVGSAFTVICVTAEVALQPLAFVTSTVYAPEVEAVYVAVVPTCIVPLNHL